MSGRRRPTGRVDYTPTTTPTKVPLAPEPPPLPGRQLTTPQILALARTAGYLEARIDLARTEDEAAQARDIYRDLAANFPDLTRINLIEEKHL